MSGTQRSTLISTQLRQIAEQAIAHPDRVFTSLIHRMDFDFLREAFYELRRDGAPPQGGVISPLLANMDLHYVLDEWFESEVKPRMRGHCFLVRFADDFVIGFQRQDDARRVMEVLPKRFGKYGLEFHPEKSLLLDFSRPARTQQGGQGANIRLCRSYPLLGEVKAGILGHQTQNGTQEGQEDDPRDLGVVSPESTPQH